MTLREIIELANEGYERATQEPLLPYAKPDGTSTDKLGDTLALFIVRELGDVYDSKASDMENLTEARRVMYRAIRDLNAVYKEFNGKLEHEYALADDETTVICPMP